MKYITEEKMLGLRMKNKQEFIGNHRGYIAGCMQKGIPDR